MPNPARLDAVEAALLKFLHDELQAGRRVVSAAKIGAILEQHGDVDRCISVIAVFESRGYLLPVPPREPPCSGPGVAGSVQAVTYAAWYEREGSNERWMIGGRVIDALRSGLSQATPATRGVSQKWRNILAMCRNAFDVNPSLKQDVAKLYDHFSKCHSELCAGLSRDSFASGFRRHRRAGRI